MVLLVVGLTALLALLDRAGRRRQRDGDLRRLAFEDSLTGLPNRSLFEQRIAETLAARRSPPSSPSSTSTTSSASTTRSATPPATACSRSAGDRLRHALRDGGHRRAPRRRRVRDPRAGTSTDVDASVGAAVRRPRRTGDARGQAPAPARQHRHRHHREPATTCCATPTSRCTRRRPPAPTATRSSPTTCTSTRSPGSTAASSSSARSRTRNWSCTTSRSSTSTSAASPASRRWSAGSIPERGLLGPGEFIPLAEETGLIVPARPLGPARGRRQAATWAGAPYLSVNVAGAQLEQAGFVDEVAAALSRRRPGCRAAGARGHRVLAGRRPRGGAPAGPAPPRRPARDRRLRHRLLVASATSAGSRWTCSRSTAPSRATRARTARC